MNHLRRFLIVLVVTIASHLMAQDSQKDLERLMYSRGEYFFTLIVSQPSEIQAISEFCSIDGVCTDVARNVTTVVCFANQRQYENLIGMGYLPQLQMPSWMLEKPIMWDGSHREAYEWDAYPTYEAYEAMMQAFATEHPERCSYFELGTLDSGRKLMFCRINNGQPDGKPRFLYTSTMHGNEPTGFMLMLRLIDELCTSNDDRIVNLVNDLDIFICPNTNPDGTYYGGNHTVQGARRGNANNIDLNRHYPDFDKGPHPDKEWCYQDETRWLMDLAQDYKFTMAANFHTGSEVLNYPWDTHPSLHADDDWWKMVCHEYADQCHEWDSSYMNMPHQHANNGIINGYQWYTISGSRQDYMNYYAQCREVTIETSNAYIPTATLMPMYWNYNHNSMLSYMEQCLNGIHGTITDAETGEPVEATVSITGHDHHGSEVSSHLPAGDYHRPIKGGTYNVTYSAYGYDSQTITISVNDNEAITQNVQLTPNGSPLVADFSMENDIVPVGAQVKMKDLSKGAQITQWLWEFPGGIPSFSSERSPYVVYPEPGKYDVTLTIGDAEGQSESVTMPAFVEVYEAYPMQNGTFSTSKGLFFPSGGVCGFYDNNESLTMTFLPSSSSGQLQADFMNFSTEAPSDALVVYDGASTNAPQVGSYSGSHQAFTITSTNTEGALTFRFTSNGTRTYCGWRALIHCIGDDAIEESSLWTPKVYPNPAQGHFTIEAQGTVTYRLHNPLGQCILTGSFKDKTRIATKDLPQGLYYLHLCGENGRQIEKIIIEK